MTPGPKEGDLRRWSESLAAIARTGLGFTKSSFEAERYEEVLHIAAEIGTFADHEAGPEVDRYDQDQRYAAWRASTNAGIAGYVTPKVAVGAIVGDDKGRILLIQRADSGVWLYPTGWADVGYSPAEVVVKEVHEETGIQCKVERLIGVVDGLRAGFGRIPLYSLLFSCRSVGGTLSAHPSECLDAGWFSPDGLPEPLVGFERWGKLAFDAISGKAPEPVFDQPRQPVWRSGTED